MNSIVLHQYCSVISEKNVSSVLLYGVKLNNVGHINITSIMKRLNEWGTDFFLHPAWKFPSFPEDIPEISWKYRNSPFSLPEEISALGLCKVAIQSLGKLFRTVQRVIPGSEAQNYDDI
jgi:hypothetical protein